MPTGDGLLVRLMPTEPLPLDAFTGFCEAARQHGNGTIEISARGSLQVRGLTPRSAPLFASAVAELGIVIHEGVSVIAGFDPIGATLANTTDMVAELRRAIASAQPALSPKASIVVDGGGRLHLDALSADIRLRVMGPARQPRFCVGLGGDGRSAIWLGSVEPNDAVNAVLALLTTIVAYGPTARAADILRADGVEAFHSVAKAWMTRSAAPSQRMRAEMVGLHPAHDGSFALGIGLAFGHSQADALVELAGIAAVAGARAMRPAPDRAMQLIGVMAKDAVGLTAAAEQLGFVTRADDPRRRIAACPGAPACASGLIEARALASAMMPVLEPLLGSHRNGVAIHISGCQKGCAHPMPAALTLVGASRGCGVVHHGSARATPDHYVDPANLDAEISQIMATTREVVHG
jgi:precorrin-3B synthase